MSSVIDVVLRSEGRASVSSGRLRRVRTAANLSQVELGRALGLTAAAVQRWEAGERMPRGGSAERLALLLREIEQALERTPEMREPDLSRAQDSRDNTNDGQPTVR